MSYPCPSCQAAAGDPCRSASGTVAFPPHVARGKDRRRCKVCQVILPDDQDVADVLCTRCTTVRRLELERSTLHQRET